MAFGVDSWMGRFGQTCNVKHPDRESQGVRVHDVPLISDAMLACFDCLKRFIQHLDYNELRKIQVRFFRRYSLSGPDWSRTYLEHVCLRGHTVGSNYDDTLCRVTDNCPIKNPFGQFVRGPVVWGAHKHSWLIAIENVMRVITWRDWPCEACMVSLT